MRLQSPFFRCFVFFATVALILVGNPSVFAQTYKNPRLIPTGSAPSTVSSADLNNDGKMDLVYTDGAGLHILLGNGDGTFQEGQDLPLPQGVGGAITIADVNKDGVLDLILGGSGPVAQVGVFLGHGDGTFGSLIITQFQPLGNLFALIGGKIGVADVNEDGAVDLIAADTQNNAIYILFGNNTGSFTLHSSLAQFTTPGNVHVADFNGDHHADFIVDGRSSAGIKVFLGNGDGSFQPGVVYTGPFGAIVLADMNGDGHLDIVGVGQDNSVAILLGNSDGTFSNISTSSAAAGQFPKLFAVSDLNSDGFPDLLTISQNGLCILTGKANFAFSAPQCFVTAPNYPVALLADFNGDGHKDVVATSGEGLSLLLGIGDGTFQSADSYDTGQSIQTVAVADFNQDHHLDIAAAALTGPPIILLGTGTGKFTLQTNSSPVSGALPSNVLTGDFDGDGKPDLLFSNTNDADMVLFGNGDGTFTAPVSTAFSITGFGHSAVADFNRDGRSDILTGDYSSYHIILGQSNRTLPDRNVFLTGTLDAFDPPVTGDFNGDGIPDFAFSLSGVQIFLGNGDGTFRIGRLATSAIPGVSQGGGPIAVGDFDGDGKLDIVMLVGLTSGFEILYGNGDGTFQDPVFYQVSTGFSQLAVADLDGDGKPDLVFSDGKIISTIHNEGNRTFGPEQHYLAGNIGQFVVQDVNGDGLPDIIVANGIGTSVTVLLSQASTGQTKGLLNVTPEPSVFGQQFNMALAISAVNAGRGIPTGSVRFLVDNVPVLSSVPLSAGSASLTYPVSSPLAVGVHTITADYSGDAVFLPALFAVSHTIDYQIIQTTTALTAQPSTVVASQTVHFVATSTSSNLSVMPLAIVAFHDGIVNLGVSPTDANGVAVFDTALLSPGTHSITAVFLGVSNFNVGSTYASSTSNPVTVVVNASPTTSVASALQNPVSAGTTTSLRAVVSSGGGTPFGAVTFFDGGSPLATQPLDASGMAVYNTSFAATGTHIISANYGANASFASSMSAALHLVVTSAAANPTSTALAILASQAQTGSTLSVSVTVNARIGTPKGTISILDGGAIVGQSTLDTRGSAVVSAGVLTAGVHYFTASFPGDSEFGPSVSPVQMVDTAKGSDFSLTVSSQIVSVVSGRSGSVLATINPINGFKGYVVLSCMTSAPNLACTATPTEVFAQGTSLLTISAFSSQAGAPRASGSIFAGKNTLAVLGVLFSLFAIFIFTKRRRPVFLTICFGCVMCATGCSSSSVSIAPVTLPGSYTISIQAVAAQQSTPINHSVQVVLNVSSGR